MVVCDGETWIELPITAPRPLIESEVALATDQKSVALPPPSDAGEAVNEEIVGRVALLPANGTSGVCRGTSCIAGIICDPRVVALLGGAMLTLGAAPVAVIATVPTIEAKPASRAPRCSCAGSSIDVGGGAGALDTALAAYDRGDADATVLGKRTCRAVAKVDCVGHGQGESASREGDGKGRRARGGGGCQRRAVCRGTNIWTVKLVGTDRRRRAARLTVEVDGRRPGGDAGV